MARTLIASGHGTTSGGGLVAVDGSHVTVIDRISSTGLAYDGRRLARILRCSAEGGKVGEAAVYDARGIQRYLRLDNVVGAHDVAWDGDNLVVVSPWHNTIQWFSPAGDVVGEVRYPGPYDAWHVNCVMRHEGAWYATVFANFGVFRVTSDIKLNGAGKLINLATGAIVIDGLSAPHTPRVVDGLWIICNSLERELVAVDGKTGRLAARVPCGMWTRGLAYDDDFFYVGGSKRHLAGAPGGGEIIVIDRRSWQVADRIPVPFDELYDVVLVPPAIVEGLKRGFDVNPERSREFNQHRLLTELGVERPRSLWPSGDPLAREDCRCSLEGAIPATCKAESLLELPVRLTNRGRAFFTNAPPAPVVLSYKWLDPVTRAPLPGRPAYKTRLERTLFPQATVELNAIVPVPKLSGPAILRLTLLQEGVAWFDEIDPANGLEATVTIQP